MAKTPPEPFRESEPAGEVSPWALAGLGMQFAVAVLGFVYVGNWLDRRFSSAPVMLLTGLFAGGGGVFYVSYRRLMATGEQRPPSAGSDHDAQPPAP